MKSEELILQKRRQLQESLMYKIHGFRKQAKSCIENNSLETTDFEGLDKKQRKIKQLKKLISLLNWIFEESEEEVD